MEKVTIGNAELYCGNFLDMLEEIDKSIPIITDPPYGISHSSSYGASWKNTQIAGDSDTRIRDLALSGREIVAAFGTWKTPPIEFAKAALVWNKGPAFGMGDLAFPWKPSWELIYIRGNGWKGKRDEGVLTGEVQVSWESKGRTHPHQKPVGIVAALIYKLPDYKVICDPFMGSGTTGVAAMNLEKRFIGVELERRYFDIACERISQAQAQARLAI